MMKTLKFNSAICTSREQSLRLLALGLKKETADCNVMLTISGDRCRIGFDMMRYRDNYFRYGKQNNYQPAWSLSRLFEMLPPTVMVNGIEYRLLIDENKCIEYVSEIDPIPLKYFWEGNLLVRVVTCIEWLIKEGYFNKEYLEE